MTRKYRIDTILKSLKGARIVFDCKAINEDGEIINEAQITVACVKKERGKPVTLQRR